MTQFNILSSNGTISCQRRFSL